jgi:zinc transporter ZupT
MKKSQTFINSIMLCFGAGVILATAMLHILPECREGLEEAQKSLGITWLTEAIFCAGFFLVYLVEEIVHLTLHRTRHREQIHSTLSLREPADKTDSACNIVEVEECCESGCSNDMEIKKEVKTPKKTPSTGHGHSHLPTGSSSPMRDFFTGKQIEKPYYFK